MWVERVCVYLLVSLVSVSPGCQFPQDWLGAWHHLGYDDPVNVTRTSIDYKEGSQPDIAPSEFASFNIMEKLTTFLSEMGE